MRLVFLFSGRRFGRGGSHQLGEPRPSSKSRRAAGLPAMLDVSRRSSDKPGLVENRRGNIRNLGGFGGALHWFQALANGPRIAILAHKGSLEDFSILGELPL